MKKIYFDSLKTQTKTYSSGSTAVLHEFCDVLVREIPPKIPMEIYCVISQKRLLLKRCFEIPNVEIILNRFHLYETKG